MAAITATAIAIAPGVSQDPVIVVVTSSAAVYAYNAASSLWKPLNMNTT